MSDKIQYAGNTVFGIQFGMYGYENVNEKESMSEVQNAFERKYKTQIEAALTKLGMKFEGLSWWSPREYNFANDSLDLSLTVVDKQKLREAIVANQEAIQDNLDKNHSYDGFISTTISSVELELEQLDANPKAPDNWRGEYEPDILVIKTLLQKEIDFSDFDMNDYLIWEDEEEPENKG